MIDLGDITDQDFDLLSEALDALSSSKASGEAMADMVAAMIGGPAIVAKIEAERSRRKSAGVGQDRVLRERIDLLKAKLILARQARAAVRMSDSVDKAKE